MEGWKCRNEMEGVGWMEKMWGWKGGGVVKGRELCYDHGPKAHQYHTFSHQILHSCGNETMSEHEQPHVMYRLL